MAWKLREEKENLAVRNTVNSRLRMGNKHFKRKVIFAHLEYKVTFVTKKPPPSSHALSRWSEKNSHIRANIHISFAHNVMVFSYCVHKQRAASWVSMHYTTTIIPCIVEYKKFNRVLLPFLCTVSCQRCGDTIAYLICIQKCFNSFVFS